MDDLDNWFLKVDAVRDDIIALNQALVRIPSVNTGSMPTGNETEVCEYVRRWLAEDGIDSEILESAPGRGNIIARLEGRSGSAGLMFMSHTDVVPVEDEAKWRFSPFSATVADERIYGRGASDCKGLLTAQLMAMRLLKRNGVGHAMEKVHCHSSVASLSQAVGDALGELSHSTNWMCNDYGGKGTRAAGHTGVD